MTQNDKPKDWQKIRDAGYAAKLSYIYSHPEKFENPQKLIDEMMQKLPGYTFQQVRKNNVFALLGTPPTKDKPALIAFAGSDDLKDWNMNFTAIPSFDHGNHLGFNIMYESVNPKENPVITRYIDHMAAQGVETYVCGHSMGGALATLCAQEHGEKHKLNIVTLNAPSTGRRSAKHIDSLENLNITNFVKQGDFVSMGGTGSLAGDTYVVQDVAIGKSFMVTHEKMEHNFLAAGQRFMKNVMGIAFPKTNPITAHSSESMLTYMEKLAERNQPLKGVMAHFSDQQQMPTAQQTPIANMPSNHLRR